MQDDSKEDKKQINERYLKELMERLSTPEGRVEACKPTYPSTALYTKRSKDSSINIRKLISSI